MSMEGENVEESKGGFQEATEFCNLQGKSYYNKIATDVVSIVLLDNITTLNILNNDFITSFEKIPSQETITDRSN